MDIAAIRAAFAASVSAMPAMQTWPFLPGQIVAPAFVAGEVDIDYDRTFRGGGAGLAEIVIKGRLYAGAATDSKAAQAALDSYLAPSGSTSIKAAIEADLTLSGTCKTLRVERLHGYALWAVAGIEYFGAQFDVRVWA